jgi:hypothetical protein
MNDAFFTILCLVGGPFLIFSGVRGLKRSAGSKNWPVVEGKVISSDIASQTYLITQYSPEISYEYSVNGTPYSRRGTTFGREVLRSKEAALACVAEYPPGKVVAVYYDPNNPEVAALEPRGADSQNLFCLVGGIGATGFGLGRILGFFN